MFIAAPGHKFIAADYNAIEARVTAILTGAETMLGAFYSGKCPYITMASIIYDVPYEQVTKEQRFFGKQAVLGLGYGMGAQKFKETCESWDQETSLEFATQVVSKYRKINKEIPKAWGELDALFKKGAGDFKGIVHFTKGPRGLRVILPSGTPRYYIDPETSDYDASYMGVGTKTRKWERLRTYGGKILENIVQGVARDIQAFVFVALEEQGFNPVLQVHDEIICEVPEDSEKTEADLVRVMETMPEWANGWPIKAPGCWSGKWFKK
jgi:DNA polymerase